MQGRGGVNPSPGTGEVRGLERSTDRISSATPSTRPEANRLGRFSGDVLRASLGVIVSIGKAGRNAYDGATLLTTSIVGGISYSTLLLGRP